MPIWTCWRLPDILFSIFVFPFSTVALALRGNSLFLTTSVSLMASCHIISVPYQFLHWLLQQSIDTFALSSLDIIKIFLLKRGPWCLSISLVHRIVPRTFRGVSPFSLVIALWPGLSKLVLSFNGTQPVYTAETFYQTK